MEHSPTSSSCRRWRSYSQYYQKLTVDRLGRLFVSCSYFSRRDPPATRTFRRFHHRMVLISEDGGHAWRFATTADFLAGITKARRRGRRRGGRATAREAALLGGHRDALSGPPCAVTSWVAY